MKMKVNTVITIVSVALLIAVGATTAQVEQAVGNYGSVDWSSQIIRATGIGAPNPNLPQAAQRASAIEAGKLEALKNLLATVQGMSLDAETTVRNYMVENAVINSRVSGIVRGFTIVDTRYMSTGDVEVTVEMPIAGALSDALLPSAFGGGVIPATGVALCPTCGQPWPAGKPVPAGVTLVQSGSSGTPAAGGVYTGLIVDAKGLGVRPAMAPKIMDENNNQIYGSKYVSRDWAVKIGMVGYDKDVSKARFNDRVTANPLVVKGIRATGSNKADVVVSAADAAAIQNTAANMNFLDKCKVMFILD
jgi:hypothetical protein